MKAPKSSCLLNDSFPPLIDGVANTVVNYARELTKLGDRAIVVTPEHPDADDSRFPFPVARYPSVDTRRLFGIYCCADHAGISDLVRFKRTLCRTEKCQFPRRTERKNSGADFQRNRTEL